MNLFEIHHRCDDASMRVDKKFLLDAFNRIINDYIEHLAKRAHHSPSNTDNQKGGMKI